MSGAEVVELFPGVERSDADAPVRTRPRDPEARWCLHKRLEMDTEARRVYCRDCTREVPAFDALDRFAQEWEHYIAARKNARAHAKRAKRDLDELLRQERNAKARLRRLRTQLPLSLSSNEIDWLMRFIEHHRDRRLRVDELFARLRAIRADIDPPAEGSDNTREEGDGDER